MSFAFSGRSRLTTEREKNSSEVLGISGNGERQRPQALRVLRRHQLRQGQRLLHQL